MKSKLGIIIQARTGSTRLPNKMILPFYKEFSVLEILFLRLKNAFSEIEIIVATTTNTNDDIIELKAIEYGLKCFRGNELDVLNRFIETAEIFKIEKIIRICADNPFLDIPSLKILVEKFENIDSDYLAFSTSENVPTIKTHYGFWAEAVTLNALQKVVRLTNEKIYHEHVTNFIYSNSEIFNIHFVKINKEIESNNSIRLTLDTLEDFKLQKSIFAVLYKKNIDFSLSDVILYLNRNPEYFNIMRSQINKNSK